MHELSITQKIFDIVVEQAEKEDAIAVKKINLVIGEMTGIVSDSVEFYFGFLSKGTIAEDAELVVRTIPTRAKCRNCGKTFQLGQFEWVCPGCGANNMEIIEGKELFIESIEVD